MFHLIHNDIIVD